MTWPLGSPLSALSQQMNPILASSCPPPPPQLAASGRKGGSPRPVRSSPAARSLPAASNGQHSLPPTRLALRIAVIALPRPLDAYRAIDSFGDSPDSCHASEPPPARPFLFPPLYAASRGHQYSACSINTTTAIILHLCCCCCCCHGCLSSGFSTNTGARPLTRSRQMDAWCLSRTRPNAVAQYATRLQHAPQACFAWAQRHLRRLPSPCFAFVLSLD